MTALSIGGKMVDPEDKERQKKYWGIQLKNHTKYR